MELPDLVAPPGATLAAFVAIVLGVCAAFVAGVRATAPPGREAPDTTRAGIGIAAWLALTALVPLSGILEHEVTPPPLFLFLGGCNVAAIALALSPIGARLATLPAAALVGFHGFRLLLEMVLERWAAAGTIPVQMSWHGDNHDVVTGLLAVAIAPLLARRRIRALEVGFHAIGVALLVRVASIAILSAPGPLRAYEGEPLVLGYHFPYAWIVSICVAGALAAHLIGLRGALRAGSGAARA
jgi:hypothetical protein